ncbi:hypothetical protein GIB67_018985 [Kingdonia uniflora]|uniref:DNA-directed RNA polymerase n=1 Tax=Kingdonia uniflora TaxID=39325 RepID=A0A7J7MGM7_9MAGN|nr:hypothetical protein GIB67_018985 [Kingdonia uniflora]
MLLLLDISSIGFCFVRLAEGLKTTGTITTISDWILPVGHFRMCVDNGQAVNLYNIIISKEIMSDLKYSLATGNCGQANAAGTRAGVSQACGMVKNLTLMVYVTLGSAVNPILEFLELWSTTNFEEISPTVIDQAAKFFVNGCWVGIHRNPGLLVKTLRQLVKIFFLFL